MLPLSRPSLLLLLFLFPFPALAQQYITGHIYDAKDSTALQAVAVYYDGSKIGTSSRRDGSFKLEYHDGAASLIFSYLGYQTEAINLLPGQLQIPAVYLKEKEQELGAVMLETDPWSREKKLRIFRREFIGSFPEADRIHIENEDQLRLVYSPSSQTLSAEADAPLRIVNKFLGYELRYDLQDFIVEFFYGDSDLRYTGMVSYQGFAFFQDLKKRPRKRIVENRKEAYFGSTLHFMRSLKAKTLKENKFYIFLGKKKVPLYKYFAMQRVGLSTKVWLLKQPLTIVYAPLVQSELRTEGPFIIDRFGNHTPPSNVLFTGEMGKTRIGHMLPLEFFPD